MGCERGPFQQQQNNTPHLENMGISKDEYNNLTREQKYIAHVGDGCLGTILHPVEDVLKGAGYGGILATGGVAVIATIATMTNEELAQKISPEFIRETVIAGWFSLSLLGTGKLMEIARKMGKK